MNDITIGEIQTILHDLKSGKIDLSVAENEIFKIIGRERDDAAFTELKRIQSLWDREKEKKVN